MVRALALLVLLLFSTTALAVDVGIKWDANSEPDLAGYVVHRSRDGMAYQPIAKTTATAYTFANISAGRTYSAVVTAYNTSGIESAFSNAVLFGQPKAPTSLQLVVNQLIIQ